MPNRLADEQSPYLRQHEDTPVDWYPQGEEAFQKAKEDKPIFLQIGYSTCHWCHVMAHDSFEDEAEFMETNRSTVNVCPGVSLHYRWDRTEALNLDDSDRLTEKIDERVREAVQTWGAEAAWDAVLEET